MNDDVPGTMGDFLLPPGFRRPGLHEVLREGSVVTEAGRYALTVDSCLRFPAAEGDKLSYDTAAPAVVKLTVRSLSCLYLLLCLCACVLTDRVSACVCGCCTG